ncbi:arylesterase [Rufibacter hautae]|uniref:Arylesterase n=1 Tax=Rufibacter hautae TaxID=2595005 RepID=A0A5B6TGI5_9BACT|nr:arylesterase [Rufibacter hautae]KAA3438372.1 arylesterase [Rufibacter hautae]
MHKHSFIYLLLFVWLVSGCSGNGGKDEATPGKDKEAANKAPQPMKNILFFGNSLTAGYGLNPSESFPALIQKKIDSLDLSYKAINAGLSGETSAGGKNRIDWLLRQPVDIFVLELGANDGLRGIPPSETKKNLQAIVDKVKAKYPDAKLVMAGMEVPPNMGGKYASEFRVIFRQLAEENNMALVPFLLEGVGGVRSLNQADGVHPTAAGQKILANNVWEVLEGLL